MHCPCLCFLVGIEKQPEGTKGGSFKSQFIFFDTLNVYFQPPKNLSKATVQFMPARLNAFNYTDRISAYHFLNTDVTGYSRHFQLMQEAIKNAQQWKEKAMEGITVTAKAKSKLQLLDEKYTSGFFPASVPAASLTSWTNRRQETLWMFSISYRAR